MGSNATSGKGFSEPPTARKCAKGWWNETSGTCTCMHGFTGSYCSLQINDGQHSTTNANTRCINGILFREGCLCSANYVGSDCGSPNCNNHGMPMQSADPEFPTKSTNFSVHTGGTCKCDRGWREPFCNRCSLGYMGDNCFPVWYMTAAQVMVIALIIATSVLVYRIRASKRARDLEPIAHQMHITVQNGHSYQYSSRSIDPDTMWDDENSCCPMPLKSCFRELFWCCPDSPEHHNRSGLRRSASRSSQTEQPMVTQTTNSGSAESRTLMNYAAVGGDTNCSNESGTEQQLPQECSTQLVVSVVLVFFCCIGNLSVWLSVFLFLIQTIYWKWSAIYTCIPISAI